MEKLVILEPKGRIVFVGDTHGDHEASQAVFGDYLDSHTKIVFLGDYVDTGKPEDPNDDSRKNTNLILDYQEDYPRNVFPLLGNHEVFPNIPYDRCDFWAKLSRKEKKEYHNKFLELPLALSVGNILAVHGGLPDLETLADFNKIENCTRDWYQILWGDFKEERHLHRKALHGRTAFSENYFKRVMNKYKKELLIRGHDQNAPIDMYDEKCLTLLTSKYIPTKKRVIAVANFDENPNISSIDDLELKVI